MRKKFKDLSCGDKIYIADIDWSATKNTGKLACTVSECVITAIESPVYGFWETITNGKMEELGELTIFVYRNPDGSSDIMSVINDDYDQETLESPSCACAINKECMTKCVRSVLTERLKMAIRKYESMPRNLSNRRKMTAETGLYRKLLGGDMTFSYEPARNSDINI